MHEYVPLPEAGFRVDWANLNNALFALICADDDLCARYQAACSLEARQICSEQFDLLAADAAEFVERFFIVKR